MDTAVVLETRSVVDALRSEMQGQILRGSIPAGTLLPEIFVAQQFEVARPTAKAAIEQLVNIGLLRRSRNKTARVPLLDASDIADLYLTRGVIEGAVVHLLAERGEVPDGAIVALERFRAAIESGERIEELVESDIQFHRALAAATGSPRLRRLHESVIGEAHLCMAQVQARHLLRPQIIANEHKKILAMIRSRSIGRATAEMEAHLARAQKKLVTYLRQERPT